MNSFFKALIAGWGAKKLGGGCLSTIVIFIVIYTLLGKCSSPSHAEVNKPAHVKTNTVTKQCAVPVKVVNYNNQ
jgi:hypothetical protein